MKVCILALVAGVVALAQSSTTTYTPDLLNGGVIPLTTSDSTDHTQTQVTQSLNGREVPLEQHQERVLSRDSNGNVTTETIVHKYDPTGDLISTERTITEQHNTPGGGSTVKSTTYRTGLNGEEQPAERRTVDTVVTGSTTTVNTVVDRPGPDGSLQTSEKRTKIDIMDSSAASKKSTATESVYRRDPNDNFAEAERKVTTETKSGSETVVKTTEYQPGGEVGALQFQEQRIATTVAASDGSQTTRVDVYAPAADGFAQDAGGPPQLKQEQIITHAKAADGSVRETFSVREPSVSDATHLGPPRTITETVCTGKCDAATATPPASPPATAAPQPAKP